MADDAQNLIGVAYSNLKDFNKVIDEFKKVSLKYPKSNKASISLYDIAYCYFYNLYDYDNAKNYYQLFVQVATEEDRKWYDIAVEQLHDCEKNLKKAELLLKNKETNDTSTSSDSKETPKITYLNPQDEFKKYLLENTALVDVRFESDYQIWVYITEFIKSTKQVSVK